MLKCEVGSAESSDLMLSIDCENNLKSLELVNLSPEIPDTDILIVLNKCLRKYEIPYDYIKVIYNGANEWVIDGRCEALSIILKNNII